LGKEYFRQNLINLKKLGQLQMNQSQILSTYLKVIGITLIVIGFIWAYNDLFGILEYNKSVDAAKDSMSQLKMNEATKSISQIYNSQSPLLEYKSIFEAFYKVVLSVFGLLIIFFSKIISEFISDK
jgi:hypothetical protein